MNPHYSKTSLDLVTYPFPEQVGHNSVFPSDIFFIFYKIIPHPVFQTFLYCIHIITCQW